MIMHDIQMNLIPLIFIDGDSRDMGLKEENV